MTRLGLVANPSAGSSGWLGQALPRLARLGPLCVTGRADDIPGALVGLRKAGIDVLVVVGGDGTLHAVMGSMQQVWDEPPMLYLVPGGTAGLVHHNLGVAQPLACIAELEALARGDREIVSSSLPTLRVGHHSAFNVGVGLPQRFAARALGRKVTAMLTVRLLTSALFDGAFASRLLQPWQGTISLDDGPEMAVSSSILYASALSRLGPLRAWSGAEQPLDGFRLLQVPEEAPSSLLLKVPAFALGQHQGVLQAARKVRLVGAEPFVYVADGEPYVAQQLEIGRGPSLAVARVQRKASTTSSAARVEEAGFWPVTSFPSRMAKLFQLGPLS
jgi:hypothetical protein